MGERPDRPRANRQIQQEAARWLIDFNADEPDSAARAEFDRWLRASPEHIRAYLELLPLWQESAGLAGIDGMSREDLIALASTEGTNVAVLSRELDVPEGNSAVTRPPGRRYFRPLAAAAAVIAAVAAAFWLQATGRQVYRTGIAEIRTLALEDGTRLSIGARSTVVVEYSKSARAFRLDAGDIYVDVAKDPARPLTVEVKGRTIRALGTQFEVRTDDRSVRVSVIEGLVSVSGSGEVEARPDGASGASPGAILLQAGQQLTSRPGARAQSPQPIRSKEPAAWRAGRLVFDDEELGDVIREFNRYNRRAFKLADPALERIPIAAAFSSADPGPLIRFLRDQPGIVVSERPQEIVVDSRR